MAKKKEEVLWICNVCNEEYTGSKRKWTCPCCGTADSFEKIGSGYDDEYDDDRYNEDDDY